MQRYWRRSKFDDTLHVVDETVSELTVPIDSADLGVLPKIGRWSRKGVSGNKSPAAEKYRANAKAGVPVGVFSTPPHTSRQSPWKYFRDGLASPTSHIAAAIVWLA